MGGRWVEAALVVLGIISSMNLPSEGSKTSDAIKKLKNSYFKIIKAGKPNVNDPCEDKHNDIAGYIEGYAGVDPDEEAKSMISNYLARSPGVSEDLADQMASKGLELKVPQFQQYEKDAEMMCSLKKGLMCVDGKCVDCEKNTGVKNCGAAKKIAKTKEKEPASGGVWIVRPVDGALVAALLAFCALSA